MYQHANKIFRKGWEMHISPIKKTSGILPVTGHKFVFLLMVLTF